MTTQRQPQPGAPGDEPLPPESTPTMISPSGEDDQQREVAVLQQQVRQLQQAVASQQAQIAALIQRLSQPVEAPIEIIEAHEPSVTPSSDTSVDSAHEPTSRTTSRRGLLKWGGLGAAAALAVGAAGLNAAPVAHAADGGDMILGSSNSASAGTLLINNASTTPQGFVVARQSGIPSSVQNQTASIMGIGGTDLSTGVVGVATGAGGSYTAGVMGIALLAGPDLFANGTGAILQKASTIVGPPPGYDVFVGQLIRDHNGDMYLCMDLGNNDLNIPPRWKKLGSLTNGYNGGATGLLPTPVRMYDSRKTGGPFHGNTARSVQITPTAPPFYTPTAVPLGAVGCVGNLTVVSPTAGGYLVIYPQGSSTPSTSTVNFAAGQTVANSFIVGLGNTGQVTIHSFTSGQCHVVLDVTGFIN